MNEEGDKKNNEKVFHYFTILKNNNLKRCCQCGIPFLIVLEIELNFMTMRKEIFFHDNEWMKVSWSPI